MLYAVYALTSLLLSVVFLRLMQTAVDLQSALHPAAKIGCLLCYTAAPMLFLVPSSLFPAWLRPLLILLIMLLRAGSLSFYFQERSLKMLYISVLTFVTNANYSTLLQAFTKDNLKNGIAASLLEAAVCLLILHVMKQKNCVGTVQSSIRMISRRLYLGILLFLYLISLFEYTAIVPELNSISQKMVLPICLAAGSIIARIMRVTIAEKEQQQVCTMLEQQLGNQVEYYDKINQIYMEFRGFRHDFANHLICLRSLLAENKTDEALAYMDEMEQMSSRTKRRSFDTGNVMIDALLNDKCGKAAAVGAKIVFHGYVPTMGITNIDLCTMIANAVDNAIEACAKNPQQTETEITVDSDFQQGIYFFSVTNPCFERVEIKDGNQVKTSKENKQLHGFGVSNIVKTVEKYSGTVSLNAENGVFTLNAELMLKQE